MQRHCQNMIQVTTTFWARLAHKWPMPDSSFDNDLLESSLLKSTRKRLEIAEVLWYSTFSHTRLSKLSRQKRVFSKFKWLFL